jgi:hypothetical protein
MDVKSADKTNTKPTNNDTKPTNKTIVNNIGLWTAVSVKY